MSTLPRESVPQSGFAPGVLPAHEKVDGTYARTGENAPLPMKVYASEIMQPVEIQGRYAQTIQTHNAVSVPLSSNSQQTAYMDTNGFNEVAITLKNDASASTAIDLVWSHDGVISHAVEQLGTGVSWYKLLNVPAKARYLKLTLYNLDSTAAHTMSAWAYLKA